VILICLFLEHVIFLYFVLGFVFISFFLVLGFVSVFTVSSSHIVRILGTLEDRGGFKCKVS